MEVKNGDKFILIVCLVEFMGIFCYEICNNLYSGSNYPCLVYMTFMIICFRFSGGHLNPAVTIGVYIERREYKKYAPFALAIIVA
jgi:hypothetical protein